MKRITGLLALLLALALVFSMTACGNDGASSEKREKREQDNTETALVTEATETTEAPTEATEELEVPEELVGAWKYTVDMGAAIAVMEDSLEITEESRNLYEFEKKLLDGTGFDVVFEFGEDGAFALTQDKSSLLEFSTAVRARLPEVVPELMTSVFGVAPEELEAQFAATGMTMDEIVAVMEGLFSPRTLLRSMDTEAMHGTFSYEDGVLILRGENGSESRIKAEFTDNMLTFLEIEGKDDEFAEALLPMTFVKFVPEAPAPAPAEMLGAWKYTANLDEILKAGGLPEGEEDIFLLYEGVSVVMVIELNEDNTCRFSIDPDSLTAAAEKFQENANTYFPEKADQYDAEEMLGDMRSEHMVTYLYQDGKLIVFEENYPVASLRVELNGDELWILDSDMGDTPESMFPVIFVR
ncbi:MAG: hypothetical protein IJJ99_08530 [Oscillospiraceae bacterium]|nr:hypothetical protein [Oscillospiraceae bacterium]